LALTCTRNPVPEREDTDAIADALRNLNENAVLYAPAETEVTLTVSPNVTVSMSDRGPGMARAEWADVFERFWRNQRERRGEAGFGLAIVAETARAHGDTGKVGDAPGVMPFSLATSPDLSRQENSLGRPCRGYPLPISRVTIPVCKWPAELSPIHL